jgi:dipeptidyl aminopeptidase/acylaminoacyl peptidase
METPMRTWSVVIDHPSTADPTAVDSAFPPTMGELSFESGGSKLNGLTYVANGPGPHPTVIILHGYPGNERNLDLAQAIRRAGMNVLYFDYRGTWGSGGEFSIAHALEDVANAVERARSEEWAAAYRADSSRVALVGHSLGGFLAAMATAEDDCIACFAFLAGADLGWMGLQARKDASTLAGWESFFGQQMDASGGPIHGDAQCVASELVNRAEEWSVPSRAVDLADRPLLLIAGGRDEVTPKIDHHDRIIAALREAGAKRLTEVVFYDDHLFSAHRMELAKRLVDSRGTPGTLASAYDYESDHSIRAVDLKVKIITTGSGPSHFRNRYRPLSFARNRLLGQVRTSLFLADATHNHKP